MSRHLILRQQLSRCEDDLSAIRVAIDEGKLTAALPYLGYVARHAANMCAEIAALTGKPVSDLVTVNLPGYVQGEEVMTPGGDQTTREQALEKALRALYEVRGGPLADNLSEWASACAASRAALAHPSEESALRERVRTCDGCSASLGDFGGMFTFTGKPRREVLYCDKCFTVHREAVSPPYSSGNCIVCNQGPLTDGRTVHRTAPLGETPARWVCEKCQSKQHSPDNQPEAAPAAAA